MSWLLVAWASEQQQLLEPLQAQIRTTLGNDHPPTRILILDDVIHDGGTALLALGLLWTLYPSCNVSLMAGLPQAWRQILGWHWVETERPEAMTKLIAQKGINGELADATRQMPNHHWGSLLAGMVDNVDDPLGWLPLTEDTMPWNEVFMAMGPLSLLLALAPAMKRQIRCYLEAQLAQGSVTAITPLSREQEDGMPQRVALTWQEKLWAHAWPRGVVDAKVLLPICGATAEAITAALEAAVKDDLMERVDSEAGGRYAIVPQLGALLCGTLLTAPNPAFVQLLWSEPAQRQAAISIEYAYANPNAAGAPILIPVVTPYPQTIVPVVAVHPATFDDDLLAALREQAWLESEQVADLPRPRRKSIETKPSCLNQVGGLDHVFYYHHEPTLAFVLDHTLPAAVRAERLAEQAIASVTAETYRSGADGIAYLAQVTAMGMETPLTPYYVQAILRVVGDAPDLETARERVIAQM